MFEFLAKYSQDPCNTFAVCLALVLVDVARLFLDEVDRRNLNSAKVLVVLEKKNLKENPNIKNTFYHSS